MIWNIFRKTERRKTMEKKLFDPATITVDGRMDEPQWAEVAEQTGFYLLVRDEKPESVYDLVIETLGKIVAHEGEIFGKARKECGNYLNLDIDAAKRECESYLEALRKNPNRFEYPKGESV